MTKIEKEEVGVERLVELMARLRAPEGCPWDREQTYKTLVPFIIEEAYEVIAAIDDGSQGCLKDELGDLLFQIIFICRISQEKGGFGLKDVVDHSVEKMVRRHPHVFGDAKAETSEEVLTHWAEIKKAEKKASKIDGGYLAGIPETLPALLRAHKVSQKAAKAGFDWENIDGVISKIDEEVLEFKRAVANRDKRNMEEELGDIIFTLVNVSRFIDVNPEDALRKTIGKFITRFHKVEKKIIEAGKEVSKTHIDELERLWQETKKEM